MGKSSSPAPVVTPPPAEPVIIQAPPPAEPDPKLAELEAKLAAEEKAELEKKRQRARRASRTRRSILIGDEEAAVRKPALLGA